MWAAARSAEPSLHARARAALSSVSIARDIVAALGLEGDLAAELLAVARPDAGRSFTRS